MTGQQFQADPQSLRSAGEAFHGIGTDFGAAAGRLKSTLDGLGKPWGDDSTGEIVSMVYDPIKDGMDDSMPHLATVLATMGLSLGTMADNYQQSDDATGSSMGTLNARRPDLSY
jgi:hypothetical protein